MVACERDYTTDDVSKLGGFKRLSLVPKLYDKVAFIDFFFANDYIDAVVHH